MKKSFNFLGASFFAILIFFSSCASLGIEKRYHQGGFHLSFRKDGGKCETQCKAERKQRHTICKQADIKFDHSPLNEKVSTAGEEKSIGKNEELALAAAEETISRNPFHRKSEMKPRLMIQKPIQIKNKVAEMAKKGLISKANSADVPDSDIQFILYLILCLVLPPLAYYLIKDETDTLFWICLLCFLFTFTWLGGFQLGLLGAISVIIAILALLNKI